MVNIHKLEDGGSVVGDCDVVVWRDHHLVQTLGTEGRPQGVCHGSGGQNVTLESVETTY